MKSFNTKAIVFSGTAVALATICATYLQLGRFIWANGGEITLFSMLMICLIGNWYGPKVGIASAVTFGILRFILQPFFIHPVQVILDYPLAFGALGLSGFFCDKKNGLLKGFIMGVLGRLFFASLSGLIFYTAYVGSLKGNLIAAWGSILYNISYIAVETVLTLIVISIPPVAKALREVKRLAVS
ncbi:MAG: energy-coupled thiamine transporter ThiT [Lachnospiraceae bacterium]|nr:energy-coupled thiamine transporter ThiT [Lachnospiraceae bacterium]